LEVGFGLGISATYVQELGKKTGLREHVIIEPNDGVFARLENFAKEFTTETKKVTPMRGFWEEVVPTLESGSFDGILFDPFVPGVIFLFGFAPTSVLPPPAILLTLQRRETRVMDLQMSLLGYCARAVSFLTTATR
jgi:hypothetical protein